MLNFKKNNLLVLAVLLLIRLKIFGIEVNSSQNLIDALSSSQNVILTSDITLKHAIHLLPGQTINGANHKLIFDSSDSNCQVTLTNNVGLSFINFVSKNNNETILCGSQVNNVNVNYNTFESDGYLSSIMQLDTSSNISLLSNSIYKNGIGLAMLVSSSTNVNIQNNFIQLGSSSASISFYNTSKSIFGQNTVSLSSGTTDPQIGVVVKDGTAFSISQNVFLAYSQQVDVVRLITGNHMAVANNIFYLLAPMPKLAIGIFFGDNNETPFNLNDIIIQQNNFYYFTISSTLYFSALNFSATSVTNINVQYSNGNIIGPGKVYGGVEKGALITGTIGFRDGTSFPSPSK